MDENDVKLRLTVDDEASPAILALLGNIKRVSAAMGKLGKAPPSLAGFDAGAVAKVQAMAKATDDLAAAQGRLRSSADTSRAQDAVSSLRTGPASASRVVRQLARDRERVEADTFKAWRTREGIRRRSTAVEEREQAKAEGAMFRRYRIGAAIKRATLAQEQRQRRDADRAAERDARAAHGLFQQHARAKLRVWRMSEVERLPQERGEQRRAAVEQRAADRHRAGTLRDMRTGLGRLAAAPGRVAGRIEAVAPPAVVSAVTSGAVVAGLRGLLRSEASADEAEINMRIASGMSADDARKMRNGWAAPTAVQLGMTAPEAMRGWTEATKVGIPDGSAKEFVELSQKASAALEVPIDRMNEVLGIINAQQGGKGDIKALSGVTNAVSFLADKLATTPDKLISFMQRGSGAASVLGMHQDAGLAFGAAATSLGIQAGSAGRMFDFMAGRTINLPNIVKKHGAEGEQARQTVKDLGYGNVKNMDRIRRADPDNFIFDLMERFSKIKDPRKRERDMRFFAGQEWFGELSSMVGRVDTVKQARDLAIQARGLDALGKRWELHRGKLSFLFKQMTAGTANIMGSLGQEIAPLAREAGDFYLKWSADIANGNLHVAFRRGLDGIVEGLLGKPGTLSDLMTSVFGAQGARGEFDPAQFFAAARGFASGLRATYDAVSAAFSGMAGVLGFDPSSAESMAKFTGEFLAFGAALRLLQPVVGVMSLLTAGVSALTTAGSAVGALAIGGALLPVTIAAVTVGTIAVAIMNWDKITSAWDDTVAHLKGLITGKPVERSAQDRAIQGAEGRRAETLPDAQRLMPDQLGPSGFLPMSYREPERKNWRDLMTPAAFHSGSGDDIRAAWRASKPVEDMSRDMRELRAAIEGGSVSGLRGGSAAASLGYAGGGGGGIGGSYSPAGPGGNQATGAVNAFGLGRRGIMGGGSGGAPSRSLLDFIAKSEGTSGYNTSWGNGRFMPGGVEQDLTGKSLNEVLALGRYMRSRPGSRNSSAMGRYQITGSTIQDLMKRMGLNGSEKFDAAMQDRMASRLISDEGPAALNRWEGLKSGGRMAQARGLLAAGQIAPQPDASGADLGGNLAGLKRAGVLSDEQCVTLAMAGVGIRKGSGVMGANVHDWRRGVDAAAGTLQPGQAVATFLNRNGSRSDLYAGGGAGTPGAHLDHAGVFQRYLMDGAGKRIGMEIAEQFKGFGGTHLKRYMFGQGWGEGNASNYSAIMTKDGRQLGGGNPGAAMVAADAEKAKRVAAMGKPPTSEAMAKAAASHKDGATGNALVPQPTGADIAASVPTPMPRPGWAVGDGGSRRPPDAPPAGGAAQGGGAGGVQIHVHGGSSDPEAVANKVHKRLSQTMNWRTHEVEMDV